MYFDDYFKLFSVEDDGDSIHMSEGGQRESYEDLRLMLSELLDEKEK